MTHRIKPLVLCLTAALISACNNGTGGGAGDLQSDTQAQALITPLVGLYALPESVTGVLQREAFLDIAPPNEAGIAVATLLRKNPSLNCIEATTSTGEVVKDPVGDRVFLNNLPSLGDAVLSRSGTDLVIDIANGGILGEMSLQATRLNMMVIDLGETCQ